MTGVLRKGGILETDTDAGRMPCEMKAEIRVMYAKTKKHRLSAIHQKPGKRHGTDSVS